MAKGSGTTKYQGSGASSAAKSSGVLSIGKTTAATLNNLPIRNGASQRQAGDVALWENALSNIPNGETYSVKVNAGTTTFGKSSNGDFWISQAPFNEKRNYSTPTFIAVYLSSMGNLKKDKIKKES